MKMKKLLKSLISLGLILAMAVSVAACGAGAGSTNASGSSTESGAPANTTASSGPITIVWYPNESAADYEPARAEFGKLVEQATGKKVEHRLTTDYAIAIEALASGTAQICFMGAQGKQYDTQCPDRVF